MADNSDNFGGTKLTGENGEQMDPAIAGISPPRSPLMGGDAAGAAISADLENDDAGGETKGDKADLIEADAVLDPEPKDADSDDEADVTASGAE